MTRVLFHMAATASMREELTALASSIDDSISILWCDEDDDTRLHQLLPDTDVIWHLLRPLDSVEFDAAPGLQLVQKLGSGVNTIDVSAAVERGIAVANMPGTNAAAVAEATIGLMIAAMRGIPALDAETRAGRGWPTDPELAGRARELAGTTVGLIGDGAIARRVGRVLSAFDAIVLHTSRSGADSPGARQRGWRPLDELLAASAVISLHVPATPETSGMLDARRLALLPAGAVVVNTARGSLIDEGALVDALRSGHVAAAGLDVFAVEPLDPAHELLSLPNVVVAPHVAWVTAATLRRCVAVAAENVRLLSAGDPIAHRVA